MLYISQCSSNITDMHLLGLPPLLTNSFYTCLAGLYKNGQLVEHPDSKPWVEDSYWEIKRSNNAIVEEAYKQFSGKTCFAEPYFCVRPEALCSSLC